MKSFFQKLVLKEIKPIEIRLTGGNFEIITQHDLSVIVDASGMTNLALVPVIRETALKTIISNHSLGALLPHKEKASVKIYVPENCRLTFRQDAGNVVLHGHYSGLKVNTSFGNIKVDLTDFVVDNDADFRLFAGDVKFRKPESMPVKIIEQKAHSLVMQMGGKGKISARVSLGDVVMKETFKKF